MLLWPGDVRAGDLFSDASLMAAMVRVEAAWLAALHEHGLAPSAPGLDDLVDPGDLPALAEDAEGGGNPVIPLLAVLRARLAGRDPGAAEALHAGLTSQDVLDTALVLNLRATADRLHKDLSDQVRVLSALADRHRGTRMAGRTLTQHAIPITFGLKAAGWLHGVLDARDLLETAAALPIQAGGAAGSLAAPTALTGAPDRALSLVRSAARTLDLPFREPWHTARAPFTRIGDAFVSCTDAWGKIANDVLLGSRPEIGELTEAPADGRGGSSTMPNKHNPVLAVLVRRAALAAPPLAATLHAAAAEAVDERPDGSWHVEWPTLQTLARRTVVAGSQTAELLAGLQVDPERMAATLAAARPGIDAERHRLGDDGPYLGATEELIDAALTRAGKPC
ncbi:lyase family protein [Paractinoplanes rishiriensis]|uniref:3-carboxy-cis,cis-muconate cycloisomerase n=1 Tax=Paractinoplanes rishiriensis TaxID=1050105 RepID=A0A919K1U5_9ACTN|nr:lyase family protein [Actinoplanes rishiriensis]GIE97098.1 3-carboxy-cis,cis-muconate cycloisomerase [Actinoplanes rishiriensis]